MLQVKKFWGMLLSTFKRIIVKLKGENRSKVIFDRIQQISHEGVSYVDDLGQVQFIEFEACYQNAINQWLTREHPELIGNSNNLGEDPPDVQIRKNCKAVGVRNATGRPYPYIEFYSSPSIRFYFKTYQEFRKIADSIINAGWQTLDGS